MSRSPTLEDVAALAGVSTATVSRCLNAPEKVVEGTRARVLEAIEALGYAPNFSARALAARRTRTIGAIIPTMENAIFAEGIQAFQEVLQGAGYTLLIASSGYDPALEAQEIRTLVARGAEALLLIGHDRDPRLMRFLETQGVPVVVAWAHDPAADVVSVGFDNRAAMRALAGAALAMGHRRVGVISARLVGNDRARARLEGIRAAAEAAGIGAPEVIESDYGIAEGGAALGTLLARAPETTLAICGNDVLAAGAIREAAARGIAVPGRLSITGFDDIALAALVTPPIATVRVPHRAMGETAAQAILALVAGEAAQSRVLPTELCLRESLAPPPG